MATAPNLKFTKGRNNKTKGRTKYLTVSAKQTKETIQRGVPVGTKPEKNKETPLKVREKNREQKIGNIKETKKQ